MTINVEHNPEQLIVRHKYYVSNPTLCYAHARKVMDSRRDGARPLKIRISYDVKEQYIMLEGRSQFMVEALETELKRAFTLKRK